MKHTQNRDRKGKYALVSKFKFAIRIAFLIILAVAIIKVANVYIDLTGINNTHAQEIKGLQASKQELAIREAQHLALISDVEAKQAEKVRLATPISERLMLPNMAVATAYTCDPTMTPSQKAINCPNGKTAMGEKPAQYHTVACDRMNLGKKFMITGFGEVSCTDLGGAIKGSNRFDIYMDSYADAISFGTKILPFTEIK